MTISSAVRTAGPYTGNSATTVFPFAFKVFLTSEIIALRSDGTTEVTLVLGTDYTVALNADQNASPGGTVTTLGTPLTASYTLTLTSSVTELQGTSLTNQGGFYPKVIENALDRAVILIQQLRSIANRSLRFPLSDTGTNTELPVKNSRANNLLGFDSNGNPVAVVPTSQSATALQIALAAAPGGTLVGYTPPGGTLSNVSAQLDILYYGIINARSKRFAGGIVGDGAADDTAALQAWANAAVAGAHLYLPASFCKVTAPILLPATYTLRILGDGMYASRISMQSVGAVTAIFDTTNASIYDTFEIKDIQLNCNSKAGSGIRCEQFIHSMIDRVLVMNATTVGIRINNGYSNTIQNCIITGGVNGIDASGTAINNLNILNNEIYAMSGYGINVGNGLQINIRGNGIEACAVTGIFAYDIKALCIEGNYFERNGATGFTYTTPEILTIKADIHILSGGRVLGISTNVDCCRITGNSFTPYGSGNLPSAGLSIDCPIFTTVADKMVVTQNQVYQLNKITALVGLYRNNTKAQVNSLDVTQNSADTVAFLGVGLDSFVLNTAHNIETRFARNSHNYAAQLANQYAAIAGTTGSLVRSSSFLEGYPALEMSAGDHTYGFDITLANFPELLGKYVWFGVYYRVMDAANTGLLLKMASGGTTWSDNDGSITEGLTPAGTWQFKSVCKLVGVGDATLSCYINRIGAAGNPLIFAYPIVAVFGDGVGKFPVPAAPPIFYGAVAPTVGTWAVGDRVINKTPVVGQPKAWSCTVAGTPGTWVSEGNL